MSPGSQREDVVLSTPLPSKQSRGRSQTNTSHDAVLSQMISANADGLRKRRLNQGLSPELQVLEPAPKHRLVSAKLNISQLFE